MRTYAAYIASLFVTHNHLSHATAPEPHNFPHALARLLTTDKKPMVSDFDEVFKAVLKTTDYQELIASQADPDSLAALLDDVRVPPMVTDSGAGLRGSSPATESAAAASTGLALSEIELKQSHDPVSSSHAARPMARMAMGAGDSGLVSVSAAATVPVSTDPATAQYQSTKYIITTIDTLVHIMTVLNAVEKDVNAGNYLGVITTVDEQCNFMISKLAEEAVGRVFTSGDTAAKWRDALKQLGIKVATYVAARPGPESWPTFKAEILAAIGTLIDYAVVAKATMEASTTPPPTATNEQLQQQLQNEAVDAGCMCLWKCLFSICGGRRTATTAAPSVSAGGAASGSTALVPSTATAKTLELALFIDSTVATIQSIIHEVRTLEAAGPEGQQRLKNLQLRIGLRVMSLLKQAIANDALEKLYDTLKTRSAYLIGSMNGVSSASAWDSIKGVVADTLTAIVSDLNASKPADVFATSSSGGG